MLSMRKALRFSNKSKQEKEISAASNLQFYLKIQKRRLIELCLVLVFKKANQQYREQFIELEKVSS